MRRFLIILFSVFFLSFDLVEYSLYQKDDGPSKIKATHLYVFTKYFEWPGNTAATFNISILGDNPGLMSELTKLASTKTVGSKKIEIKNINTLSEANGPEILFILSDKSSVLAEAVSKFKGKGTLIVTEKQGLAKVGSAINFVIVENNIKFELNKTSAGKAGLKVSSKIEPLASKVLD
jgi:hypothetical protein